jgi:WhiB family redox-sensing transcriptional regulator
MFTATACGFNSQDASSQPDPPTPLIEELLDAFTCTSSPQWNTAHCSHTTNAALRLFFSDDIAEINQAKRICVGCPVAAPCLQGALDRHEPCGVWGGYLVADGQIVARKRPRGRPPKHRPTEDIIQLGGRSPRRESRSRR